MPRQATLGALLLVTIGVVLGATVFRSDIAQATGLGQSVTVANTPAQAVPVREQNLDNGNIKVHEQGTAAVRDIYSPAANPVTHRFDFATAAVITPTVPSGQRFIIQTISVTTADPGITTATCRLFVPGGVGGFPVSVDQEYAVGLEQVFIPISAGENASLSCGSTPVADLGWSGFTTGYFVPAP